MNFKLTYATLILNYNGAGYLQECLESLQNVKRYSKIYLIDNGSTDNSLQLVRTHFPWVKIIAFKENKGFAGGYDEAIRFYINSDIIIFLNNDTIVDKNWFHNLDAAIKKYPANVAGFACKMLFNDDKTRIDYAGGFFNSIGGGVNKGKLQKDDSRYSIESFTGIGCAGALGFRRTLYLKFGGFDPRYFMYHEDVDLCLKSWLMGYKIAYIPSAIVYHVGAGSAGNPESTKNLLLMQKNRLRNLLKYYPITSIIPGLVFCMMFDCFRAYKFLVLKDIDKILTLIQANAEIIFEFKNIYQRRSEFEERRLLSFRDLKKFHIFQNVYLSLQNYLQLRV